MRSAFVVSVMLAIALVAVGCGSTSSVAPSPTGSQAPQVASGKLGDTLTIGPLKITPTKVV